MHSTSKTFGLAAAGTVVVEAAAELAVRLGDKDGKDIQGDGD